MTRLMTPPLGRAARLQKVLSRAVLPGTALETSQLIPPARARSSMRRVRRATTRPMVPPLWLLRTMRLTRVLPRVKRLRVTLPRVVLVTVLRGRMSRS